MSRLWLVVGFLLSSVGGWAQDSIPACCLPESPSEVLSDGFLPARFLLRVQGRDVMPGSFVNTSENRVFDPLHSLDGFFYKLALGGRQVRIVHIGDSHVRGHAFPKAVKECFERDFGGQAVVHSEFGYRDSGVARETGLPGPIYDVVAVNGATAGRFDTPENIERVGRLRPDLVIVSFGTNEAHTWRYDMAAHRRELRLLVEDVRRVCPDAAVLLTTPPGAWRGRRRGRRVNPNTPLAVRVVGDFARDFGMALWDLYGIVGGESFAVRNWQDAGLMRRDGIHFSLEGYLLQGRLLYEALINEYNDYVGNRMD